LVQCLCFDAVNFGDSLSHCHSVTCGGTLSHACTRHVACAAHPRGADVLPPSARRGCSDHVESSAPHGCDSGGVGLLHTFGQLPFGVLLPWCCCSLLLGSSSARMVGFGRYMAVLPMYVSMRGRDFRANGRFRSKPWLCFRCARVCGVVWQ